MIMKIIIFMTEILFITLSAFTGGPRVLLETLSQMIIGETIVVAPPLPNALENPTYKINVLKNSDRTN